MPGDLFAYYERELTFIRHLVKEFQGAHPAAAGRLWLDVEGQSKDPHVERLIQAFAVLAARVQLKLDNEFPELTDALLSVLYPHYLAPIPSMTIVQFQVHREATQAQKGFAVEPRSQLFTEPVLGVKCPFRTSYPVTLWPIEVTGARLETPAFEDLPADLRLPEGTTAALRLHLRYHGERRFADLALESLRFYLHGTDNALIATLYELIFNRTLQVVFINKENGWSKPLLPQACLRQVGLDLDEGLLAYPKQAFPGYRLLTEFFTFPKKFLFVDLLGWGFVKANLGQEVEVVFFLDPEPAPESSLRKNVTRQTFRLGCTPALNLFEVPARPILLTQEQYEYQVVPTADDPSKLEVYAIHEVVSFDPDTHEPRHHQPFYSFRHGPVKGAEGAETRPAAPRAFWYATRQDRLGQERWTDVYLNLVDLDFQPALPDDPVLQVELTCTNGDLPRSVRSAREEGVAFSAEKAIPARIVALVPPTGSFRPPFGRKGQWRLISHLSLNHLSLTAGEEGRQALQELLRLYDVNDPIANDELAGVTAKLIDGITGVSCRHVIGRPRLDPGFGVPTPTGFCRGIETTLEFNQPNYEKTGVFLFASVLERFLGLYATVNSFTQLVARVKQKPGILKKWEPRAGEVQLL